MTIFVGHVPESVNDVELASIFTKCGKVINVDRKKNYAFIDYEDRENDRLALKLFDGYVLNKHTLSVELSNRETGHIGPSPGNSKERCYICGVVGHISRFCPKKPNKGEKKKVYRAKRKSNRLLPIKSRPAIKNTLYSTKDRERIDGIRNCGFADSILPDKNSRRAEAMSLEEFIETYGNPRKRNNENDNEEERWLKKYCLENEALNKYKNQQPKPPTPFQQITPVPSFLFPQPIPQGQGVPSIPMTFPFQPFNSKPPMPLATMPILPMPMPFNPWMSQMGASIPPLPPHIASAQMPKGFQNPAKTDLSISQTSTTQTYK